MKRLVIIGEGPTEQAFCREILSPFYAQQGIAVEAPKPKKTKGGITSWEALKRILQGT